MCVCLLVALKEKNLSLINAQSLQQRRITVGIDTHSAAVSNHPLTPCYRCKQVMDRFVFSFPLFYHFENMYRGHTEYKN